MQRLTPGGTVIWLLAGAQHHEHRLLGDMLSSYAGRIGKLVYVSSCAVYGMSKHPSREDGETLPQDTYAETKVACESLVRASGVPFTTMRLATVHGLSRFNKWTQSINSLALSAVTSRRIYCYGGQSWRPMIAVRDAVRAIVEEALDPLPRGVINVATEHHRFGDVHALLVAMYGCRMISVSIDECRSYLVSAAKYESIRGRRGNLTLQESIHQLGCWIEDQLEATHSLE